MRQPDSQKPAVFFDVEALGEVQRIIISVPGEEAALAKLGREFKRRVSFNSDGDCGATLIESLGFPFSPNP